MIESPPGNAIVGLPRPVMYPLAGVPGVGDAQITCAANFDKPMSVVVGVCVDVYWADYGRSCVVVGVCSKSGVSIGKDDGYVMWRSRLDQLQQLVVVTVLYLVCRHVGRCIGGNDGHFALSVLKSSCKNPGRHRFPANDGRLQTG